MAEYDVIVIGGGPGGYIAAERLAAAGRTVLLAEPTSLGGTCLNVGCIPTKALLNSAKLYQQAQRSAQFGVTAESVAYDWAGIQAWKNMTVSTLVGGVAKLLAKHGVEVVNEPAWLLADNQVEVAGVCHQGRDVIVATGSVPVWPSIPGAVDNPGVVDSTGLLGIDQVPERLAIIGGGVIGVEFASVFSRLGASVHVIEMMDEILPFMDPDLARCVRTGMSGVEFQLGAMVESIDGTTVHYARAGQSRAVEADLVLMAVGRRPQLDGWGVEATGLKIDGGVVVDDRMRTNLEHVWAVGDVTGRSLLAHAAYRMGEVAAAGILGGAPGQTVRWDTMPWAVYCHPEAAGVGLTAAECARRGIAVEQATAPLVQSGRFVAEHGLSRSGQVKVVAEKGSRVIRGIQMVGPYAPETIWGAAAVLEMEFTVEDVQQLVFPHPSISEGIREAVWAFPGPRKDRT